MRTRRLLLAASVSIIVSFFRAPSETVEPALRKLNMICGVHGSPGNRVTEPTWSNRKPVGAALACAGVFFICAQPARPAKPAPAINNANESFLIAKDRERFPKCVTKSEFALLGVNPMQQAMNKWCKQHRYNPDKSQARKQSVK